MIRSILVSTFIFFCALNSNAQCSAVLSGGGSICEGESINLTIDLTGTPPWSVQYENNGVAITINGINNSPYTFTVSEEGIYALLSVSATGCSSGTVTGTAEVVVDEAPSVVSVNRICDPTNVSYTVVFEITGGDPASYTVSPMNGTLSGNTFTSNPIISSLAYSFLVDDANNCDPVLIEGTFECNCDSQVGEMDLSPIQTCSDGPFTGFYDNTNEFLDADDVLLFYLHEGAGNSLINPIAASATSAYSFDLATMQYGQTYFISAVVGSGDGNGGIDLSDPCLSVSQGTPITFFDGNIQVDCVGGTLNCNQPDVSVFCTVTGGQPPYIYEWIGPNGFFSDLIAPLVVEPGIYTVVVTDINGCTGVGEAVVEEDVNVPICNLQVSETLSCINTAVEVFPECIGGTTPYIFTWPDGQTSETAIFEAPGTYVVTITDANGCISLLSFEILSTSEGCGTISGNVRDDEDLNCLVDLMETPLSFWTIRANNGGTDYFGMTDGNGYYEISVPPGNFNVEIINNIPDFWDACTPAFNVSIADEFDVDTVDFSLQKLIECPAMQVDISTPFLRRCFTNYYHVNYCNNGTVPAEDAYIEIALDLEFIIDGAGVPFSSPSPGLYVFEIGEVGIGECGSFSINTTLQCGAVLGETLCTEAHIFPDTNCIQPDPLWSGASLEITSQCDGGEVTFFITNIGAGDMAEPSHYIVIEDGVMLHADPEEFFLLAGETEEVTYPANGSTYILQVDQVSNHPGLSAPIQALEGCGFNNMGSFSTGFVNQFPEDDADPFISIDCQEVIGSYDPNDKYGYPEGYGDEQLLELGQDLEYRIRFQNTGTDTAFKVVIEDVLSPHLDLSTLRPGAASHPYELDIFGSDTLVFTFNDILLPDSNVNEPLSHGFVKFRISQKDDNELGDIIENEAAIYFDFNDPIITNKTIHKLGEHFIMTSFREVQHPPVQHTLQPNPTAGTATLSLSGQIPIGEMNIHFYDLTGRIEYTQALQTPVSNLQLDQLSTGIYFYEIQMNGRAVGRGKIVVKK